MAQSRSENTGWINSLLEQHQSYPLNVTDITETNASRGVGFAGFSVSNSGCNVQHL